jgi:hypothetical protein
MAGVMKMATQLPEIFNPDLHETLAVAGVLAGKSEALPLIKLGRYTAYNYEPG